MRALKKTAFLSVAVSAIVLSGCLGGSGGGSSNDVSTPAPPPDERVRDQDTRTFTVNEQQLEFDALSDDQAYAGTSRWTGILNGAGYRVEVPEDWNGELVMWAHGFRGEGSVLTVDSPPMRQYLLDNGYAWAASTYSTNFYDVRAGVEDTNALALAFNDIAADNGRVLATPSKYFISGVSMGGHVTGAAIELETKNTANNVVDYDGAVPFCGVLGDTELFDYFGGYSLALFKVAGVDADAFPIPPADAASKLAAAREALWVNYVPGNSATQGIAGLRPEGLPFVNVLKNLSGGERPIYTTSFGLFQDLLQSFAGADGTVTGITLDNVVDTTQLVYRLESNVGGALTANDRAFNSTIVQAVPVSGANAQRDDGLRWIPKVNGQFDIPVVTAHTLGDLFVPISMEQIYRQRAEANGSGDWLVQRAIRAPGHCDFTVAEFENTFDAMIQWEQSGIKPGGDNLLDPVTVADSNFGCTYTENNSPLPPNSFPRAFLPPCDI